MNSIIVWIAIVLVWIVIIRFSYKLGVQTKHKEMLEILDSYEKEKKIELDNEKEKFKNNYRLFMAKKYSTINIPQEKNGFEKRLDDGIKFELFVLGLFEENEWAIFDYTKDTIKGTNRKIESSSNPDFVVRHRKSGKLFAIECKYRKDFWNDHREKQEGVSLDTKQLYRYKKFAEKTGRPVLIVIGLNGMPEKPGRIFLIPLNEVKTFLTKKELENYYRPMQKFTVKEDTLK